MEDQTYTFELKLRPVTLKGQDNMIIARKSTSGHSSLWLEPMLQSL